MSVNPSWAAPETSFALTREQLLHEIGCSIVILRPQRQERAMTTEDAALWLDL
jgi:hypothetical protein